MRTMQMLGKEYILINACMTCGMALPAGLKMSRQVQNEICHTGWLRVSHGYCRECFIRTMIDEHGMAEWKAIELYNKCERK